MKTESELKKELIDLLFCDNGCWGGWTRFYEPCIPGRLMRLGLKLIHRALEDPTQAEAAARFLIQRYRKYPQPPEKNPSYIICNPTDFARKVVVLLCNYSIAAGENVWCDFGSAPSAIRRCVEPAVYWSPITGKKFCEKHVPRIGGKIREDMILTPWGESQKKETT